jgi:hypothetical protein
VYSCTRIICCTEVLPEVRKYFRTFEDRYLRTFVLYNVVVLSYEGTFVRRYFRILFRTKVLSYFISYESTKVRMKVLYKVGLLYHTSGSIFESTTTTLYCTVYILPSYESTKVRKYESTFVPCTKVRKYESTFESTKVLSYLRR